MDSLTTGIGDVAVLATDMDLGFSVQTYLTTMLAAHGAWVYFALFAIIFAETGLIIFPFLPGDSLLFVAGATWSASDLSLFKLMVVLIAAAFLGDNFNYWLGRYLGTKVFKDDARFFKKSHLDYTHAFMARHGGKTLVIARFIAIARTYAPFVAGAGRMHYLRFMAFSILGAVIWVVSLTTAGALFGNIPMVRDHLHIVMMGVLGIAVASLIFEYIRKPVHKPKKDQDDLETPR